MISSFVERARYLGARRALYAALMNMLARLIGLHLHHVFINQGIASDGQFVSNPAYVNRMVGFDELRSYAGRVEGLDDEFLDFAETNGDVCAASFFGDELVGYDFSSSKRARVNEQLDILVPYGFSYGYKGWTHPDHRRHKLSLARIELKRDKRLGAGIYYIETHNYPSLMRPYRYPAARRLHMGYIGWVEIFGRLIPFATRRARWIGLEFVVRDDDGHRLYIER